MSRQLRAWLGLLLSALGLWLALRQVDWAALGATLADVKPGLLLAAVVAEMASLWASAIRWRKLLWPHQRPTVGQLFGILGVAQLANMVLPARLGLAARAVLAGREPGVGYAGALTSLVMEKVLEGITLLPLGLALIWMFELPDWLRSSVLASAVLLGLLLLAVLVAVLAGHLGRGALLGWLEHPWLAFLRRPVREVLDGLDALRHARSSWQLLGWSLVCWCSVAVVNVLALESIGVSASWPAALLLLLVLQIGTRLPSSPANLGVFDYLGVVTLAVLGVARPLALGVTLLLHAVYYLPPSLLGVGYLLWRGIGLGELSRQAAERRS